MAIKSNLVIPSVVAMYGENGGKKLEHKIIIKSDTIPTASQKELKKIYCYSGETNDTYHHGYIYECIQNGSTYSWERIDVQPGGGSVKFVPELPETGEERYIYGVVLQETTREGYGIIQLFMWYNNSWYAAGAFDVDIDPDELVYKDNIPYATAQKVGGIKQSFDANTGVWTIITENI